MWLCEILDVVMCKMMWLCRAIAKNDLTASCSTSIMPISHHTHRLTCPSANMPIDQHAHLPTCPLANMPISQHAHQPTCLSANMPIGHHAHQPSYQSAIMPINNHAYHQSGLLSQLLSLSACSNFDSKFPYKE